MHLSTDPQSPFHGWDTQRWATPFSGFRWAVPELCNFQGRAIYCDSDFIFLSDIRQLWEQQDPLPPGKVVIGKGGEAWRLCCCVFDCERARPYMIPIETLKQDSGLHPQMNQKFRRGGITQPFQGDWNNLDGKDMKALSNIDALHYTCMNTQPQLEFALPRLAKQGIKHWFDGQVSEHPREDVITLFRTLLREALDSGISLHDYMQHEPYGDIKKRSFVGRSNV